MSDYRNNAEGGLPFHDGSGKMAKFIRVTYGAAFRGRVNQYAHVMSNP